MSNLGASVQYPHTVQSGEVGYRRMSVPSAHVVSAFDGAGNPVSPSLVNTYRINAVAERLASHIQQRGNRCEPYEIYHLCLSLSRGIDYALANGEIPDRAQELPALMQQICQRKNDEQVHAAAMVLMISVKNACEIGWFGSKEAQELLKCADEMGKIYCSLGNVNTGVTSCHSALQTIMERFYPRMKLGRILASMEAKPGYGACPVDFHITKNTVRKEKIWLLVAQTDNIETSACLISPQQVNFLLNGKGVDRRTTVLMDPGPQMPTNVTGMLKFGTNLLQAVGQFNGNYVILIAYMSVTSSVEHPVLQHYVQPAVTSVDSDIIEGHSQISLNCPISFTRIKTPVKGRSCKHFQCFDFDNFINISSRKPSWRCPHCNQSVNYADIRLDRNMVDVLKDVGDSVHEVIVHADGSWKAVLENDHNKDKMQNKAHNCEKEQTEPQESMCSPNIVSNVLDLTEDDDQMEMMMNTVGTADRKPFQTSVHGQVVTPNSTSLGMNSTGVNQNVFPQIEDDFWSGLVSVSEHPTLPDTVSPALNLEGDGHDNNLAVNSVMHNQLSSPNNLQLHLNYNSVANEYGRSIPSHISRTPIAVQALPVQQPQALRPQQNSRTYSNPLISSSSTASPHVPLSSPPTADSFNAILSDTERQQRFSRPPMNPPQVSGVNSSALQHHSATQNRVPHFNTPSPTQLQNPYRAGMFGEFGNQHLQQALNPQSLNPTRPSNMQRFQSQQGVSRPGIVQASGATANSHQARVIAAAQAARQSPPISVPIDSFRGLTGDQRGNVGGPPRSVSRTDDLINLQSEQNWRPTAPMRGSLAGKQISDDVRQRIITPTQPSQSSRPQGPQPFRQTQPVQGSRPQGTQPIRQTQPVQGSRPQGPQPIRPTLPVQSSRPQGIQPVRPTLPVQSSRPQSTQPVRPTLPAQSSRPQGPQPVRPTEVSPQLDVLVANNRNANNQSSNK
ncbi:PREDICTED: E4 SUMO-protein ligase PIAL2 isoform X2 [Lupinus angustifolius]|uniref:E4 SUMO-protein ligase PIAL2 isoform X2 n=1 Tax=Lupinus angustifolius TaxID=3871 RepID=UPI00092F9835|nr:PREDICTED: E4 SUMO-protein ligase PIAL2 isoform X2 [Lupinus angustifolius]